MRSKLITLAVLAAFSAAAAAQQAEQLTQQNSRAKSAQTTKNRTKTATVGVAGAKVLASALAATPFVGDVPLEDWKSLSGLVADVGFDAENWQHTRQMILDTLGAPQTAIEAHFLRAVTAVDSAQAAEDFALRVQAMRMLSGVLHTYPAALHKLDFSSKIFGTRGEKLAPGMQLTAVWHGALTVHNLGKITGEIVKKVAAKHTSADAAEADFVREFLQVDANELRFSLQQMRQGLRNMRLPLHEMITLPDPQTATLALIIDETSTITTTLRQGKLSIAGAGGVLFDEQTLAGLRVDFSYSGSAGTGTTDSTTSTSSRSTGKIRAVR